MLLIDNGTNDPFFNLASEEYFFRHKKENIIILYVNSPSIIVGKHQNCLEEINLEFVVKNKLPVIRRISGGGTVYHDEGNLNFTFITNSEEGKQVDFRKFIEPVNLFLRGRGVTVEVGDKNEIRSGGLKFSGNAEHVFRNRVMHHGTILFSSDLHKLGAALKRGDAVFVSRSVHSNRTNVGNLEGVVKGIKTTEQLKEEFFNFLEIYYENTARQNPGKNDIEEINKLAGEKYKTWGWNFAYGPAYEMSNSFTVGSEKCNVWLKVEKGVIQDCRIDGCEGKDVLEKALTGASHSYLELNRILKNRITGIDEKNIFRFFG